MDEYRDHKGLKLNEMDAFMSWTKTSFPRARELAKERVSEEMSGRTNGPVLYASIPVPYIFPPFIIRPGGFLLTASPALTVRPILLIFGK